MRLRPSSPPMRPGQSWARASKRRDRRHGLLRVLDRNQIEAAPGPVSSSMAVASPPSRSTQCFSSSEAQMRGELAAGVRLAVVTPAVESAGVQTLAAAFPARHLPRSHAMRDRETGKCLIPAPGRWQHGRPR
jgi:hypothetical protein